MSKYFYTGIIFLYCLLFYFCSKVDLKQKRTGPYLGEIPPDTTAKLFAPGFISTGLSTRDITISPDGNEIYFCAGIGNNTFMTTLFTRKINNVWTEPEIIPFARNLKYFTVEPCFSADGQRLYFASNRPDSLHTGEDSDLWYVQRDGSNWGDPVNLGSKINSTAPESYPSVTNNGTLYFTRDNIETGISHIYRSHLINGIYSEPELLPENVNAGRSRYNAFIAPDESFIIIPIYGLPDSYGGTDYYVCFHNTNDEWSVPINLGDKVNSKSRWEYSASLSPDGKYLFFMSGKTDTSLVTQHDIITMKDLHQLAEKPENGNPDIYWINAAFISKLKPEGF